MNRIAVAQELVKLARKLVSIEFDTEEEKKKYQQEHDVRPGTKLTVKKEESKPSSSSSPKAPEQRHPDSPSESGPKWHSVWEGYEKPEGVEDEGPKLAEAQKTYERARKDPEFKSLQDKILHKTVHYGATDRPGSFSFHAPLHEMRSLLDKQGWKRESVGFGRHMYTHPKSSVKVMGAEGDAFVVFAK